MSKLPNAPNATNTVQESSFGEGSCEVHVAAISSWQARTKDWYTVSVALSKGNHNKSQIVILLVNQNRSQYCFPVRHVKKTIGKGKMEAKQRTAHQSNLNLLFHLQKAGKLFHLSTLQSNKCYCD